MTPTTTALLRMGVTAAPFGVLRRERCASLEPQGVMKDVEAHP